MGEIYRMCYNIYYMTISADLKAQVKSGENEVLSYYLKTAKELLGEIIPSKTLVNVFISKEWGRMLMIFKD